MSFHLYFFRVFEFWELQAYSYSFINVLLIILTQLIFIAFPFHLFEMLHLSLVCFFKLQSSSFDIPVIKMPQYFNYYTLPPNLNLLGYVHLLVVL